MVYKKNKAVLPLYVRGLAAGKYSLAQAAASTGYSIHWLWHLKNEYIKAGGLAFEHKSKGRPAYNRIPDSVRSHVAELYANVYKDVNFSYFQACLEESEGIKMSYPTLCSILKEYGQQSPEAHHKKKRFSVHRPRLRRECEGDMIQIDGTPYAWFYKSGDDKRYCMVGSIDDATSQITGLYLTENECLYGYLEIMRQTCERFGVPREVYSDRAAIFCFTPNKTIQMATWEKLEVIHEKRTQWQRILEELNINQILAWSPEAKGRVERMWRTLQGQLPQWFFNRGISTLEEANEHLGEYIDWFNKKYAVDPAVDDPFWIDPPANLDDILCAQFERHVNSHGLISFQSSQFYTPGHNFAYADVLVCISERGMFVKHHGEYFPMVPVHDKLQTVVHDEMPSVVQNIVHRYLFAFAKELSV